MCLTIADPTWYPPSLACRAMRYNEQVLMSVCDTAIGNLSSRDNTGATLAQNLFCTLVRLPYGDATQWRKWESPHAVAQVSGNISFPIHHPILVFASPVVDAVSKSCSTLHYHLFNARSERYLL